MGSDTTAHAVRGGMRRTSENPRSPNRLNGCAYLQLPEEVQPRRRLHLLAVQVKSQHEDGQDHRGHDLQRDLGVRVRAEEGQGERSERSGAESKIQAERSETGRV